ncbi:hypothetical protein [Flavobacterium sp.]|uniref:hypothetical protein n=1 Tax=Flavobacterium sp. TaxID=239 RepID=UPI002601DBFB|nr:hypothetical protein [Flavobacterium sp.]
MRILVFCMAFLATITTSCGDKDAIENKVDTQNSTALRLALNEIKRANSASGRAPISSDTYDFDFVYPINVSFNNGTTLTVFSTAGLLSVLSDENSDLYISEISFPFQLVTGPAGSTTTVANETEFWTTIEEQEIATIDNYVFSSSCFEMVYPLSIVTANGQTVSLASQQALYDLFTNPTQNNIVYDFVYPFSVISGNQTIEINNVYEYNELNLACNPDGICPCPTVYEPVCVQTSTGQIQLYPNACTAYCEGYTDSDFVVCDGNNAINSYLGICFNIQYPIQVSVGAAIENVNTDSQLLGLLNDPASNASIVYPINIEILQNGSVIEMPDAAILSVTVNSLCN